MVYAVAALAIVVFLVAFAMLHIVPVAKSAVNTSRGVMKTLSNPALDDDHREKAVQQASLRLLGNFVSITIRGSIVLALSFLVIYLAGITGIADMQAVIALLSSTEVIVGTTVVLTAAWFVWSKR